MMTSLRFATPGNHPIVLPWISAKRIRSGSAMDLNGSRRPATASRSQGRKSGRCAMDLFMSSCTTPTSSIQRDMSGESAVLSIPSA